MRYYYNINGKNLGPLTEEELLAEEAKGTINASTPVIEPGGKKWTRWGQVRPAAKTEVVPAEPSKPRSIPSVTPAQVLGKLFSLNQGVDSLLSKIFRLPSFVPAEEKAQQEMMGKWAGLTSLAIWVGYVVSGFAMIVGSRDEGSGPIIFILLLCILGGGIMQYFQYHFYNMTNALLFGNKIIISGPALPRLLGAGSLLSAVILLIMACMADSAVAVFSNLAGAVIAVIMTYLYVNAESFLVRISPEETTPGRELNNVVRLYLRSAIIALQLALPLCCVLMAIALCCNPPSMMSLLYDRTSVGMAIVLFNMPSISWLLLCLSSWLFDLYDSVCALGSLSRKNNSN